MLGILVRVTLVLLALLVLLVDPLVLLFLLAGFTQGQIALRDVIGASLLCVATPVLLFYLALAGPYRRTWEQPR